jgi:hypothetical protein
MRDLIWDTKEMNSLSERGMKLLLLGNDTSALIKQLQDPDPQGYLRSYSYKSKLQVSLIGYFPI